MTATRARVLGAVVALGAALAVAAWLFVDRGGRTAPIETADFALKAPDPAPAAPDVRAVSSRPLETQPIVAKSFAEVESRAQEAPTPLRILVIDAGGFPVPGAEIGWQDHREPRVFRVPPPARFSIAAELDRAPRKTVADARGIAVIDCVRPVTVYARKDALMGVGQGPATREMRVRIRVPRRPPSDSDDHPVPNGKVVLKVLDVEGRPVREQVNATINFEGAKTWAAAVEASSTGVIEFRAPADTPLIARVSAEAFDTVSGHRLGSVADGGELVAEVRFKSRKAQVVGRAVDTAGSPIVRQRLKLAVLSREGTSRTPPVAEVETDHAGAFRYRIDREPITEPDHELALAKCSASEILESMGSVALPSLPDGAEVRVADVRLERPKPMAVGAVVDDAGTPLGGATIVAEIIRPDPEMGGVPRRPDAYFPIGTVFEGCRTRSEASGSFLVPLPLRPRSDVSAFRLRGSLQGYMCPSSPTVEGSGLTPVTLVLHATGAVEGWLRLPEVAPIGNLEIRVVAPTHLLKSGETARQFPDCVDSDGRFRVDGLASGNVTVAVMKDGAEPLAEIRDVLIPRMSTATDRRLVEIDLRDHPLLKR